MLASIHHLKGAICSLAVLFVSFLLINPTELEAQCVPPVAICQNATVQLSPAGNVMVGTGDIDNGSIASCGVDSMHLNHDEIFCSDVGDNTLTLTVTDNNSNTATCSAVVTIQDNLSPTITCPTGVDTLYTLTSCNITTPDLTFPDGTTVGDASAEFSNTHGQDGWSFGYYDATPDSFKVLPNYIIPPAWRGTQTFETPYHAPTSMCPGYDSLDWAVRRWVSDFTGTASISGNLQMRALRALIVALSPLF